MKRKYEIFHFQTAPDFLKLKLATLVTKLPTFYRIWGAFTNVWQSTVSWQKNSVCPHILLLQDSITFYCSVGALASKVLNFSFQVSCLKCCVHLLHVIMRDTYPVRCIILASLNCKMKQSLNFSSTSPSEKKDTENAHYSFVDNSTAKVAWEMWRKL